MTDFLGSGTAMCPFPNHNFEAGDWGCLGLSPGDDLRSRHTLGGVPASQTGFIYPGSLPPVNGTMGLFSTEKGMFPPVPKEGEASLAPSDATPAAHLFPPPVLTPLPLQARLPLRELRGGEKGQWVNPTLYLKNLKM